MPAHHRFHPIEIQTIALFVSFIPCLLAIFLAFAGQHLEALRRASKPAAIARHRQPGHAALRLEPAITSAT